MLRSSLITASALMLCATASAQDMQKATKIPGQAKNAGVYHLASKTWTRHPGGAANLGPDTIFNNNAGSGYFWWDASGGWGGGTDGTGGGPTPSLTLDEGRIPRTYNADGVGQGSGAGVAGGSGDAAITGLATDAGYAINGFQWGYCISDLGTDTTWNFNFIEEYAICTDPDAVGELSTRTAGNDGGGIAIDGAAAALPGGSGTLGSTGFGCWIVTIDLENTTAEWHMEGDGADQSFDASFALDDFGWEHSMSGVLAGTATVFNGGGGVTFAGTFDGPILAGDGNWALRGEGTYYYTGPVGPAGPYVSVGVTAGTGLGNDFDGFQWNNGPGGGCYWFGGYINTNGYGNPQSPPGDFHFAMYADVASAGTGFLGTRETTCDTQVNSTGLISRLTLLGGLGATCDADVLAFKCDQGPIDNIGYLAFSSGSFNAPGIASGMGRICTIPLKRLNGSVRRFNEAGTCYAGTAGKNAPWTNNMGVTGFNAVPYDTCNSTAIQSVGGFVSGNTYYFQWWHRDGGGPGAWNFSDLRCVTF